MSHSRSVAGAIAVAAIAALCLPGVADARRTVPAGERSFQQTFPVASGLCAEIGAGVRHPVLRRSAVRVLADCALLERRFNVARTAVVAARNSIRAMRAAEHVATVLTCAAPATHSGACRLAHRRETRLDFVLVEERIHAAHMYYRTIELDRRDFWHAIRRLRGGAQVREDEPIPLLSS
jgi:hypothetical protein